MFSESISTPLIHGFIDSFSFWSPVSWPTVQKMLGDAKNLCNGYGGATADVHELRCLKDVHVHDGLMYTGNSKNMGSMKVKVVLMYFRILDSHTDL
mgnify:FL=1